MGALPLLTVAIAGYWAAVKQLTSLVQAETEIQVSAIEKRYKGGAATLIISWRAPGDLLQIAAIKKQQEAAEAQGYAEGGFTGDGEKYEVAGVVHKGEWVASRELLQSPVTRPMIEALDYAQRTNTIGSLRAEDVSRTIVAPSVYAQSGQKTAQTVIVQQPMADAQDEILAGPGGSWSRGAAGGTFIREYAETMRLLKDRLNEPFVTVNTVTGDTGIKQAQDEYELLMRNKTPKSRRK